MKFYLTIISISYLSLVNLESVFTQPSQQYLKARKSIICTQGILSQKINGKAEMLTHQSVTQLIKLTETADQNGFIPTGKNHPLFSLPVRLKDGFEEAGFYTITAYFDHDESFPGHVLDYSCGNLSYDVTSGYNHEGTDFFLWPYPWKKMANDEVEVVAAESGILILKKDGNFDQHCEVVAEDWNGACILHEDGSTSWYSHLKKNSLTGKIIGDTIAQGEYLGIVGSSGSSFAPHLHFEVLNAQGLSIDPFAGSCNNTISETWWEEQLPYKDAGVNKISTHSHLPFIPPCPGIEEANEADDFYPGDSIFLMCFFRNISPGDYVYVTIRPPDQSVFATWLWINPDTASYTASSVFFLMFLNENDYGTWSYELSYKGLNYQHFFELKNPQGIDPGFEAIFRIYPVPAKNELFIDARANHFSQEIILTDAIGNLLRTERLQKDHQFLKVDLTAYKPGIYFIRIFSGQGFANYKILKI